MEYFGADRSMKVSDLCVEGRVLICFVVVELIAYNLNDWLVKLINWKNLMASRKNRQMEVFVN